MKIIVRPQGGDNLKVLDFVDQAAAEAKIVDYLNSAAPGEEPSFYRVVFPGTENGNIILQKLRIDPDSVVTKSIIESASVEDDV